MAADNDNRPRHTDETAQRLGRERAEAFKRSLAPKPFPKRFYKDVSIDASGDGGYLVLLDERTVMTPGKQPLRLSTRPLAEAIAAEWLDQGDRIDVATMAQTRLANTTLDRVAGREPEIVDEVVEFAASDLICYRAEGPEELVSLEALHWDPLLAWLRGHSGAELIETSGVVFQAQPEEAMAAIRAAVADHSADHLTALHNVTTLTGSCVLGLAVLAGAIDADTGWTAAHVDEDWQISQWGEDAEARERRCRRRQDYDAAIRYAHLTA